MVKSSEFDCKAMEIPTQMSQIHSELTKLIQAKTSVIPQLNDTLDVMMIDSLAMAELTVDIEKAFDIRIDDDVLDVQNFQGLVSYIEGKTEKGADRG